MEYGQRPQSALLARILQQMQQDQQFQPQSYGALAAGLGAALINKGTMKKEEKKIAAQQAAQQSALVRALSKEPVNIPLGDVGGGPDMQMQQSRVNPQTQSLASGLPPEILQSMVGQKLMQQAPAEEAYTLGPDETRFRGSQPIATGKPKMDKPNQMGTEEVSIGGGLFRKFVTRPDGSVDLSQPIGEPYSSSPSASQFNMGPQESAFARAAGEFAVKGLADSHASASEAVQIMQTNNEARSLLDSGMITGFGADFITSFGAALRQVGFDIGKNEIENTQAYTANMASNVGKVIKNFGSGTGLSDADREFATKMAAGDVTVTEGAIRRILDISDRQSRWVVDRHNKDVKGSRYSKEIPSNLGVVEIPEFKGIPKGVAPQEWFKMTPEERALFND